MDERNHKDVEIEIEIELRVKGDPAVKGESFLYASKNLRESYRAKCKSTGAESPWCESIEEALNCLKEK